MSIRRCPIYLNNMYRMSTDFLEKRQKGSEVIQKKKGGYKLGKRAIF